MDMDDLIKATARDRASKLAATVMLNNALLQRLAAMPPRKRTLRERLIDKVWRFRRALGFWVADYNPDEED
jgi:hypothetical protein